MTITQVDYDAELVSLLQSYVADRTLDLGFRSPRELTPG